MRIKASIKPHKYSSKQSITKKIRAHGFEESSLKYIADHTGKCSRCFATIPEGQDLCQTCRLIEIYEKTTGRDVNRGRGGVVYGNDFKKVDPGFIKFLNRF